MKINKGFTLVELLVVISVIATLTALLLPNFMGARERARDAQKVQDLNAIKTALRLYYNDTQSYPDTNWSGLGTELVKYMPNMVNIGFSGTYTVAADLDSFVLQVDLDNGTGDDDINSQKKCGITDPVEKVYAVCAN